MTTLAEKLTRLGRQAGKEICSERFSAPEPPRTAPTPRAENRSEQISSPRSPLPEELRKLLGIRLRDPSLLAPRPRRPLDRTLPGDEIAPGLRYLESTHAAPALAAHLDVSFAKNFDTLDPAHLLAFDTETTGLAGGTGTRAFMIGAADVVDGRLRVRQLLTTTMAAEPAMLDTFAGWLHESTVLLSYNGRSYDAPLLKTRYRLARRPCPITPLAHLDLLHPARRRWRGVWENCRLATIERRVLQVLREDDLPGSEAPRAWREYLQGGDARDLRRVLEHNHTDVRSLMALLAHMAGSEFGGA